MQTDITPGAVANPMTLWIALGDFGKTDFEAGGCQGAPPFLNTLAGVRDRWYCRRLEKGTDRRLLRVVLSRSDARRGEQHGRQSHPKAGGTDRRHPRTMAPRAEAGCARRKGELWEARPAMLRGLPAWVRCWRFALLKIP